MQTSAFKLYGLSHLLLLIDVNVSSQIKTHFTKANAW